MKIGYQLWSINDLMENTTTVKNILDNLKEIGYDGIELYSMDNLEHLKEIVSIAKGNDLEVISAHCDFEKLTDDVEGSLNLYKDMEIYNIVVPIAFGITESNEEMKSIIDKISNVKSIANKMGINIYYHNHDMECIKIDDMYIIDHIGQSGIELEYDVHWLIKGGLDPYTTIYTKFPAPLIHIKDIYLSNENDQYVLKDCAVGEGNLDLKKLHEVCNYRNVKWMIVEQENNKTNLEERIKDIKSSYDNLVEAR